MKENIYRSKDEAYPFLSEDGDCFGCDFEILTDEIASLTGMLLAKAPSAFHTELLRVSELIYHFNPTLRTFFSVTQEETDWLNERYRQYRNEFDGVLFVLPAGTEAACLSHVIRVKCKAMVRLMYRAAYRQCKIPDAAFDFANLLSNYFFYLALCLNRDGNIKEIDFVSRNYPSKGRP